MMLYYIWFKGQWTKDVFLLTKDNGPRTKDVFLTTKN